MLLAYFEIIKIRFVILTRPFKMSNSKYFEYKNDIFQNFFCILEKSKNLKVSKFFFSCWLEF